MKAAANRLLKRANREVLSVKAFMKQGHIIVEDVTPQVNGGRYRAKTIVGEPFRVEADIFRDGTAILRAVIRYRGPSDSKWLEASMAPLVNDRWAGDFTPTELGIYRYTIEAWTDVYATWRRDLVKKVEAGQDVDLEMEEGAQMLEARLARVPGKLRGPIKDAIDTMRGPGPDERSGAADDPRLRAALDEGLTELLDRYPSRTGSTTYRPVLEVKVDRERARFGAWYEFFPRSTGTERKHGTFKTASTKLPLIAAMGFDVVYLPPIHPIGHTHRKGKNNALTASKTDVGSPWAIGSEEGGHKAVHPELGTLRDFDAFVEATERLGMEVALDFAIQCSPDHPWVKEHPEWFQHRPDGTIKYAENPPKKYQDIYPIDFDTSDREGLWTELKSTLDHWIEHGVKIFRVDNPHTKSFAFWEWVIGETQAEHPDVVFLSEAFTRPKVMKLLAKLGFTQSYTYFTWRNEKWEIQEYLTELTQTDMAHYFRPNFFTNTPDILHEYLQHGGPSAFKIRLILASLLSPSYGIYSGYELFENAPREEGSEEYLNSEKYELRPRAIDENTGLVPFITRINEIRRKHPALSELTNLRFHDIDKENIIVFSKTSASGDTILVACSLNPFHYEEGTTTLDLGALGIDPTKGFEVHDLITDTTYFWEGPHNYVRLDPNEPAHVFRVGG
jgi:starch synthase (maltosyl-transferring)